MVWLEQIEIAYDSCPLFKGAWSMSLRLALLHKGQSCALDVEMKMQCLNGFPKISEQACKLGGLLDRTEMRGINTAKLGACNGLVDGH